MCSEYTDNVNRNRVAQAAGLEGSPSASDEDDDGGKDGESPLQIPPELGLDVAKMMGFPVPGSAGRTIMQTRHYHPIFSAMRQSHTNDVRFKCSCTFECSKHRLGQHACLYGPKIAAVVLHMAQGYISSFFLGIDWFDYWVLGFDYQNIW
jgi:hypothetical protein